MTEFFIFYAPFIVLIASIIFAFIVAPLDSAVKDKIDRED